MGVKTDDNNDYESNDCVSCSKLNICQQLKHKMLTSIILCSCDHMYILN